MIEMDYSKLKVGDKVYVSTEKAAYTVMARNSRFIICNRKIYGKRDPDGSYQYWYFICDLDRNVRGKDNHVFSIHDYITSQDCEKALKDLEAGELEVSYRNCVPLDLKLGRCKNES